MNKILITGATGFVGGHLLDYLSKDFTNKLFGTYSSDKKLELIKKRNNVEFIKVDLINEEETFSLIDKIKPDIIYHLAAITSVVDSFKSPRETVLNNIACQINILEAMRINKLIDTKTLVVSSAEAYGTVKKENLPIDEETSLNPTNPYSVSKIAQDFLGLQYFLSYGLKTVRVRPFNHVGPGQTPNFVVSSFAQKIAEIEKGKREPILPVGNLEAKRDFTDVRDVIRAYVLLMDKGDFGEVYNIGSGISYKISEILDKLLSFSSAKIKIEPDKSLFRPIDDPELVCDASKLIKVTGWQPEIPIETTLKDTLDYWRNIT